MWLYKHLDYKLYICIRKKCYENVIKLGGVLLGVNTREIETDRNRERAIIQNRENE